MEDIFDSERGIIDEADHLLEVDDFASITDKERYRELLDAYKRLLKQMRTMVRMSDIMQSKLNSMSSELERLSQIDGLTGLYNRRYVNEIYRREWEKALKNQSPLGTLMIDIDYFKRFNDTFGHLEGDICLQKIANSIEQTVRDFNIFVGRFGGEEFILLLPDTDLDQCTDVARQILNNIASQNISSAQKNCCVSVSIGIGIMTPQSDTKPETLINVADQALYRAKKDGRNCFRI